MDNDTNGETSGKKYRFTFKNEYVKIGIMLFLVVACSILFYFLFFRDHTLFGFFKSIWSSIMPFIVGAVIAYLLKPVCKMFEKLTGKWLSRMKNKHKAEKISLNLSVFLTILLFLLFIYVIFASVIPQVIESITVLINTLPDAYSNTMEWLTEVSEGTIFEDTVTQFSNDTLDYIQKILSSLFAGGDTESALTDRLISGVTVGVRGVFSFVKNLVIGLVACVYILAQRKKLAAQGKMIICSTFKTKWANAIMGEIRYVDRMFNGFINGQIIDSIIVAIVTFIVMSLLRVPYAMLISVIVGVTNVIPFFGPWIGAVPSALIILMVSPIKCLYFIIMIVAIQQIDGNIISPKILGNTTGVSSFWVLFSIVFFGGLFGFTGMVLGVPLFAVLYDLIKRGVLHGLEKRGKYEMYDEYNKAQHEEEKLREEEKGKRKSFIKIIKGFIFRHRK